MAALKLTDGGHLAKMADGRIIRFDRAGNRVEELRPGDTGYGYWLDLVDSHARRLQQEEGLNEQP